MACMVLIYDQPIQPCRLHNTHLLPIMQHTHVCSVYSKRYIVIIKIQTGRSDYIESYYRQPLILPIVWN